MGVGEDLTKKSLYGNFAVITLNSLNFLCQEVFLLLFVNFARHSMLPEIILLNKFWTQEGTLTYAPLS